METATQDLTVERRLMEQDAQRSLDEFMPATPKLYSPGATIVEHDVDAVAVQVVVVTTLFAFFCTVT